MMLGFWLTVLVFFCDSIVTSNAEGKVFKVAYDLPKKKTALLLGTSKYLGWKSENLYYKFRIEAALDLWNAKKVDFFLISGDNGSKNYNEPKMMKDDLIKRGVPKDRIYLDYAGFRTFDSVIRARDIFGQNSFVVVSQDFQVERAIFIASKNNIEAIGFSAKSVSYKFNPQMYLRELLARTLMMLDLYILGTEPKFSGEKIEIGVGKPQF